MDIGPRYLGFTLPYDLTWRHGDRDRMPGRGVCAECHVRRTRVFVRWDGTLYCLFCIHADLAAARSLIDSAAPAVPVETVWEKVKSAGGRDDFDEKFWNLALG